MCIGAPSIQAPAPVQLPEPVQPITPEPAPQTPPPPQRSATSLGVTPRSQTRFTPSTARRTGPGVTSLRIPRQPATTGLNVPR